MRVATWGRTRPIDAFAHLVADLDYPMYVVTADDGTGPSGCLVGFGTQCSIHPPRFLVCVSKLNHTFIHAMDADVLVVHILGEGDLEVASVFGEETGDAVDKFAQVRWHPGPDGRTPVLDDVDRWFAGRELQRLDAGDHVAVVLEPIEVHAGSGGPQLGYQQVKHFHPGHPA
ncbi:MAG TPA: flavin reductase family protein [Acidimicrobiales bacterium]|nr:flavin reductase family protein [Acidimicrobiales bacterium]